MVIIAAIVVIGFLLAAGFVVAVMAAIISLVRAAFGSPRPGPALPTQVGGPYAGEPYDISDGEDREFRAIINREWPS